MLVDFIIRSLPRRIPRCAPYTRPLLTQRTLGSFTSGYRRMSSSPPSMPPTSISLPTDSFQLLSTAEKAGQAEDALFEQQVRDVEAWWGSLRFEGIKRPYTATDVVSKRGALQQTYPSSIMARKLFNLLNERATAGEPVHTSEHRDTEATSPRHEN
jgi:isocitrate lyase